MITGRAAVQPPAPGRASYAASVLQQLYPAPLQVSGEQPGATDVRARYLLLPTPAQVRIVVPAGHPKAGARAVLRQLTGHRPRTRLARLLLGLAVRSGGADRLARGTLVVTGPPGADSVEHVLRRVLGRERLLLGLPVSPPRANRKPVVQVCDESGRGLAFVKVGHDPLTRELVAAEAASLDLVRAAGLAHVRVPEVLARLEWHDLSLLVLEPLPLPRRRLGGEAADAALLQLVREIAQVGGTTTHPFLRSPVRASLQAQLAACGPRADRLVAHLAALDEVPVDLVHGAWHGDLNPGNVALVPGRSMVWDWERFERDVPLGFDVLHHDLHHAVTMVATPPREAAAHLLASAPDRLAGLGVTPDAARLTARLYLLALAARYLRDNQAEAGSELGDVETWLLPALDPAGPPA